MSGILETRPDSAPEGWGTGWCADTLGLKQFEQRAECFGLDSEDVFRPLKVLPGHSMAGKSQQKCLEQGCQPPIGMHLNFFVSVSCSVKY